MAIDVPEPWAGAMQIAGIGDPRNGRPSFRALSREAHLPVETVRQLILGGRRPEQGTIAKVAEALKIDVLQASRWVDQPRTVRAPYVPPDDVHLLSKDEQDAISALIRAIAKGRRGGTVVAFEGSGKTEAVARQIAADLKLGEAARRTRRPVEGQEKRRGQDADAERGDPVPNYDQPDEPG